MERFIEIPGKPMAKGRPRVGKFGTYTPRETVNYENLVKTVYWQKYGNDEKFINEPVKIEIWAYFEPTQAEKKSKNKMEKLIGNPYIKKPDADNITKIICDALNGIAYEDDNLLSTVMIYKLYSEKAKVQVRISNDEI